MTDINQQIAEGIALERAGKEAEAIEHFRRLAEQYPDHALVIFEYAGAYDFAGREAEAVPHYRRARELGLPEAELMRWYVQFGSTLRNVGELEEALAVLSEGCARWPENAALRVFRAFALLSLSRDREAALDLLDLAIQHIHTAEMASYARAIRWYTDDLKGLNPP
jgi:tetratricopeptide (TPR) repeat protein